MGDNREISEQKVSLFLGDQSRLDSGVDLDSKVFDSNKKQTSKIITFDPYNTLCNIGQRGQQTNNR